MTGRRLLGDLDDDPSPRWPVEHRRGGAQDLHDQDPAPGARRLIVHHVESPAVVLGSTQRLDGLEQAAFEAGFEVARRRSGGGAVTLVPDQQIWIDVVVPAGDPLWDDDVERATWWLGDAWAAVLSGHAPGRRIEVHHRGVSDRDSGRVACFAALGPGEVSVDGHKVLGISQRRTRELARYQCLVYLRWEPEPLLALLGTELDAAVTGALRHGAAGVPDLDRWSVVEELRAHLP